MLLAKSQYETRELIISRFDSAKYWYDYALRILEEFENPVGILYQQNLIARDVENYGVRQSVDGINIELEWHNYGSTKRWFPLRKIFRSVWKYSEMNVSDLIRIPSKDEHLTLPNIKDMIFWKIRKYFLNLFNIFQGT